MMNQDIFEAKDWASMIKAMEDNAWNRMIVGNRCHYYYPDGSTLVFECAPGSDSVRIGITYRTKFY